jgi:hypothetical protein
VHVYDQGAGIPGDCIARYQSVYPYLCRRTKNPVSRALYLPGEHRMSMKKQAVQKTQGHKGRDQGDIASPGLSKAADPVTKGQIDSLKDKNAAKKKKGKR